MTRRSTPISSTTCTTIAPSHSSRASSARADAPTTPSAQFSTRQISPSNGSRSKSDFGRDLVRLAAARRSAAAAGRAARRSAGRSWPARSAAPSAPSPHARGQPAVGQRRPRRAVRLRLMPGGGLRRRRVLVLLDVARSAPAKAVGSCAGHDHAAVLDGDERQLPTGRSRWRRSAAAQGRARATVPTLMPGQRGTLGVA